MKRSGRQHIIGCTIAERICPLLFVDDIVAKVIKRRITTKEKPRRKNFNQRFVLPMNTLIMAPRTMIMNQSVEENRDRDKLRLKLKIGSFFSKLF